VCETPGWTYHQVIRDPPFRLRQKRTDKWQQPSRSQRCTCHPPLVTLFAFPAPGSREAKPSAGRWTESRRGEMIARGLLRSNAPASKVMMAMLSLRKNRFLFVFLGSHPRPAVSARTRKTSCFGCVQVFNVK
jgi:hypothetical protein